jgi:polyisoprenoid-binding protein YceI/mono/diheme cytochrome c family protein
MKSSMAARAVSASLGLGAWLLGAAPAQATANRFTLNPSAQTEIRFTVDAPLDSIAGVSRSVSGNVFFDPETLDLAGARIVADPKSFRTGISLRDEDLRDQFFEASQFPEIVLAVQKLSRPSRNSLRDGDRLQADAQALFTLHGVTRTLTFPVEIERRDGDGKITLRVKGNFDVALSDYQIRRPARLFLKLGELAQVHFQAVFLRQAPEVGGSAAVAAAQPPSNATAPPPEAVALRPAPVRPPTVARLPHRVARKGASAAAPTFEFAFNTPEGRGERLYRDASIGGPGNAMSCASCHSTADERLGIVLASGSVKPAHTLYDAARRPTLWQGFTPTPGKASSFCARMFMLVPQGLDAGQQRDLEAYLLKLSPDPGPNLDYHTLALTKHRELPDPLKGDPKAGAKLTQRYCESCHAEGAMRPALTPGLYEADYLVKRIRWQPGHDAHQMPVVTIDRLTDTELRDIVTYLVGNESQRIFKRQRASTSPPSQMSPPLPKVGEDNGGGSTSSSAPAQLALQR